MLTRQVVVSGILLTGVFMANTGAQMQIEQIVYTGNEADGTDGFTYAGFRDVVIGASGKIAYSASLFDYSGERVRSAGVWTMDAGTETLLGLRGNQAPGVGMEYAGFGSADPLVNSNGDVIFVAEHAWPTLASRHGIWLASDGVVTPIAHAAVPVPGVPVREFVGFGRPVINSAGDTAFFGRTNSSPDRNTGIWATSAGELETLVLENDIAHGTSGAVFDEFRTNPVLNSQNDLVFWAELKDNTGDVTNLNDMGIWLHSGGTNRLLIRAGDSVPSIDNAVYGSVNAPTLNDSGTIAYLAQLRIDSGNGTTEYSNGLFRSHIQGGDSELILRGGDAAPGTNGDSLLSFSSPIMNSSGNLLFEGRIDNTGQTSDRSRALWIERDGEISLLARKGDDAPGLQGAILGDFEDYALNASGDVAVMTRLASADPNNPIDSRYALWYFHNNTDSLELIARTGQLFDVNPDPLVEELKVITLISFEGGSTMNGSEGAGLNDNGMIAFDLQFDDGSSGIFLTQIPAPSSVCALSFVSIHLLRRRRSELRN